ncbi:MAG: hypothetical protein WDM96_04740 [Lacunisphaera sp.]
MPDEDALPAENPFVEADLLSGAAAGFSRGDDDALHVPDTGTLWTAKPYDDFVLTFERQAPANTGGNRLRHPLRAARQRDGAPRFRRPFRTSAGNESRGE